MILLGSAYAFGGSQDPLLPDGTPPPDGYGISVFRHPSGQQQDTNLILDQQTREQEWGTNSSLDNQNNLQSGKDRAGQMVDMLKTEEMQNALQKVTKKGKQALQEDPSLRTPLGMIAGAVGLWVGSTVKLIKRQEFTLTSRIEARARSGEFTMESPFLNGKFKFSGDNGAEISMNRAISSIDSQAEFNYNLKDQSFSTSIRHKIAPNLDFTFGAQQLPQSTITDGNAKLEFRLDF
ncbi:MAG: hypothetical protein JST80_06050 [Bdellovibrionales bacterium]|nr:hypothetical protein [Bdellovibrionales bacterium]